MTVQVSPEFWRFKGSSFTRTKNIISFLHRSNQEEPLLRVPLSEVILDMREYKHSPCLLLLRRRAWKKGGNGYPILALSPKKTTKLLFLEAWRRGEKLDDA